MSNLKTLIKRCDDMDITEQINIFNNALMPHNAKHELEDLLAAGRELVQELKKPPYQADINVIKKFEKLLDQAEL